MVWAIASHGRNRGSGRSGAAWTRGAAAGLARLERTYEKPLATCRRRGDVAYAGLLSFLCTLPHNNSSAEKREKANEDYN
jgi:hypothetical protein